MEDMEASFMEEAGMVAFHGGRSGSHDFLLKMSRGESAAAHHCELRPKEPRDDGEVASRAPVSRGRRVAATETATETELGTDEDGDDAKSFLKK
ncbi:hypothetical protein Bca4012_024749 [Brassica carinata]